MTWINVDAEKLNQAAATLRETKGEIQALADYAREADPDWWMWGLGGIPFAALYFPITEGVFHPALEGAQEAIEGLSARLEECAAEHGDNDEAIAEDLANIGEEIGGGSQ